MLRNSILSVLKLFVWLLLWHIQGSFLSGQLFLPLHILTHFLSWVICAEVDAASSWAVSRSLCHCSFLQLGRERIFGGWQAELTKIFRSNQRFLGSSLYIFTVPFSFISFDLLTASSQTLAHEHKHLHKGSTQFGSPKWQHPKSS